MERIVTIMAKAPKPRERMVQQQLHAEVGGNCEESTSAGRIDVITSNAIYEIKDFRNWKAAIGQILVYRSYYPKLTPTIYLFGKAPLELRQLIQKHCDELHIALQWHDKRYASTTAPPIPDSTPTTNGEERNNGGVSEVNYENHWSETDDIYPSIDDYLWAFRTVPPSENQKRMLRAHYNAPEHTITATQLAHALGYKSFAPANLHYGKFAERIRQALRWWHYPDIHICIFNTFLYRNDEWHWIMHPELAEALEKLGWV